ncbi:hypothetical protein [Jhaorihella thermophila]|uniref:Uncharacterized protein n=1 Tax=Jhaorihella thermophila TaxID=488547 RepID=A0A1H5Y483_9RHOB|nr:hypothetical protein [Jhaorihella thermophila]SEG18763.1 hypothetical protein SAMN05421751_11466 [Jhaorihella thermophila]
MSPLEPRGKPARRPTGSGGRGGSVDVILHVGAHRCATTSFQSYLRRNTPVLARQGIGFWGPIRTRGGLLRGVIPRPALGQGPAILAAAADRIGAHLERCARRGVKTLIVSDENIVGSMRDNRMDADLYLRAGDRVASHVSAFGGNVMAVVLNIRALDRYWASALGYGVGRGLGLPGPVTLAAIASLSRGWRGVIEEIAQAAGGATVLVAPFECFAGRADAQLRAIAQCDAPFDHAGEWKNETPDLSRLRRRLDAREAAELPESEGRWNPFSDEQAALLRQRHDEDLRWLAAGADGLARLLDETDAGLPGEDRA